MAWPGSWMTETHRAAARPTCLCPAGPQGWGWGIRTKPLPHPPCQMGLLFFSCWRQGDGQDMPWPQVTPARGGGNILAFLSHSYLGPRRAPEGNPALLLQPTCPIKAPSACLPASPQAAATHQYHRELTPHSPLPTHAGWPHPTLSHKALGRGLGLEGADTCGGNLST